jgi:gamma-glutamyltranspeptidase/glutathione hydrolase
MASTGEQRPAVRAPVYGRNFMVVSGHSSASMSALAARNRGGNVVDAAIAASAALAAVLGQATTIGGDCFVLVHEASSGKLFGLNASGVAPAAATPDIFRDGMKVHGPLAAVVPGLVRGWQELHNKFGRLRWSELFEDAIAIAEDHPVSYILATRIEDARAELTADPGCAGVYLPNGNAVALGDSLRQPALAATLRRIATDGAEEFYTGETARSIAAAFERSGGLMTAADLAAYRPMWVEPISTDYRGHAVSVMPPNSCGGLLLMQIDGLSAVSSSELAADPGRRLGYQMSAMKAAFRHGKDLVTDPALLPDAAKRMLAPEMKALMREAVLGHASPGKVPGSGGTACVLVADTEGNMICIVQSIYNVFGSAFMDPATGILFNNRMQDFDHRPGLPGSVGPARRPFHTLCPIMVHKDGRPRYALASPGGISQTLTGAQVLTELLDVGSDVSAAVEAPRWCNRKSGDFLIEPSFPESMIETLAAMGHKARRGGDPYFFGSAKAIEWLPSGNLAGAGDHRREAFVLGA